MNSELEFSLSVLLMLTDGKNFDEEHKMFELEAYDYVNNGGKATKMPLTRMFLENFVDKFSKALVKLDEIQEDKPNEKGA